jgi:biofilm PGA synthesis protein PgaD
MAEIEIRDNPKLKSFLRNITESGFTGVMWGIWIYLLLPVINIILWLLGVRYFHITVIEQVGYQELLGLVSRMGLIVLTIFLIMRLWGYYNYRKFGRKSRRRGNVPGTVEQLAAHYNISVGLVKNYQSKKEIDWHIAEEEKFEAGKDI